MMMGWQARKGRIAAQVGLKRAVTKKWLRERERRAAVIENRRSE